MQGNQNDQQSNGPATRSEPIPGNVVDYDWIAPGTVIVEVESDDEVWRETYEFVESERVDA